MLTLDTEWSFDIHKPQQQRLSGISYLKLLSIGPTSVTSVQKHAPTCTPPLYHSYRNMLTAFNKSISKSLLHQLQSDNGRSPQCRANIIIHLYQIYTFTPISNNIWVKAGNGNLGLFHCSFVNAVWRLSKKKKNTSPVDYTP